MNKLRFVTIPVMGFILLIILSIPITLSQAEKFPATAPQEETPEPVSGPDTREAVYNPAGEIPSETLEEYFLESVIGTDGRARVTPTTGVPNRYIAKLYMKNIDNTWSSCTGYFIGPHTILTAGHCLYTHSVGEGGSWRTEVWIYPALDEDEQPYGSITVYSSALTVYIPWIEDENTNVDIGWITLPDDSMGLQTGFFTFDSFSNSEIPSTANIDGYPGDLINTAQYHHSESVTDFGDTSTGDNMVSYHIDTAGGQSGAPVWTWNSSTADYIAFAVHAYGVSSTCNPGDNCGVRIVDWMASHLESASGATRGVKCYALDARPFAEGTGTVTTSPTKSTGCPNGSYLPNTWVTVTASAIGSNSWLGWSGYASGTSLSTSIQMTSDKYAIGHFFDSSITPTPQSPDGTIFNSTPEFHWDVSPGATFYRVLVHGPTEADDYVIDEWILSEDYCDNSSCTYVPTTELNPGSHLWWIQGFCEGETTFLSSSRSFSLYGPPETYDPSGKIYDSNPTFTWERINGADEYEFYIGDVLGLIFDSTVSSTSVCGYETTCSYTPSLDLEPGEYSWWLKAKNDSGVSDRTELEDFEVMPPPTKVSLYSPSGRILEDNPWFEWEEDPGATEYRLYLSGPSGNIYNEWISAQGQCYFDVCVFLTDLTLEEGNYTWYIQSRNPAESGPWSDPMSFRVSGPEPLYPAGRIDLVRPEFNFEEDSGADMYRLFVSHAAIGTVINNWYNSSQFNCFSGQCVITADEHLRTGNHSWRIQSGISGTDYRYWYNWEGQPYLTFKLLNTTPPDEAIVPVSPTGGEIVTVNPTYTWNAVERASWYKVFIGSQDTGKVYNAYHRAADVCYGTQCEITPAEYWISGIPFDHLAYDTIHNWYVMPVNVAGNGSWSSAQKFRTEEGP